MHPGESFQKTLCLNNYYRFIPGTEYRVVGYFYPDFRRRFFVRTSNIERFRIDINREKYYRSHGEKNFYRDVVPALSPEETVYLFLSAELKKNWNNYMKYLNMRKFITAYDRFASKYTVASEREKPVILREFEKFLTGQPADRLISFQIIKKEFDRSDSGEIKVNGRAYVTVRAKRQSMGFSIVYHYRYVLERVRERYGFWKIVHVTAKIIR